jgi:hypothetical protein
MVEKSRWKVPLPSQPKPEDLGFDLDHALESTSILGIERARGGVVHRHSF